MLSYRVRPYSDEDLAWLSEDGYAGPEEDPSVAIEDPAGRHPTIWFNRMPEPKTTKNRLHLDVAADPDELVVACATVVLPEGGDRGWTVLADPEGDEFCAPARWAAGR